ncbi:MAG: L-lactate permease, partial [Thermoplasmata archaeon]
TKTGYYSDYNINLVVGSYLSQIFGTFYIYVAPFLGLFGAVVGGSETGSNVLFYKIQKTAAEDIGYGKESEFMTIYAAHANAGGIASAITPSKVNNATATIGAGREIESAVMRKNIVLVLLLTTLTGIMTALFLHLSI